MEFQRNDTSKRSASQFVIHQDETTFSNSKNARENIQSIQESVAPTEGVPIPLVTSRLMNRQAHSPQKVELSTTKETPLGPGSPIVASSSIGVPLPTTNIKGLRELAREASISENGDAISSSYDKNEELSRLKKELEAAKDMIAKMDAEISLSKSAQHTLDQAFEPPMSGNKDSGTPETFINSESQCIHGHTPGSVSTHRTEIRPISSLGKRSGNIGGTQQRPSSNWPAASISGHDTKTETPERWTQNLIPTWLSQHSDYGEAGMGTPSCPLPQRPGLFLAENTVPNAAAYPMGSTVTPWNSSFQTNTQVAPNRPGSSLSQYLAETDSFPSVLANPMDYSPPMTPIRFHNGSVAPRGLQFQPHAFRDSQSPATTSCGSGAVFPSNPWNSRLHFASNNSNFMSTTEPMNYRRLLDRNMSCNWKHVVEKIVCNNDQQASIFLQQKLKVATTEQKHELIQAIIDQAYPLMVNRFGNFLVQRCFEHGTPHQVSAIANVIQGNVLNLSMDAFGCHVIQKAFDVVPENYKATMVHELLRRIPETVIHRYACHVWQKLFELRWSDAPPQIMKHVNEALRGMWHEVALGETGSLVVQNIFENCLEEDKRPCISEVLSNIDLIAHGQFGNWCIQHICEHGAPADKSRAIDHVLQYATEYSTDQYASKVVEKCLKVGGPDFLELYLGRVCEGRADRPRMPLIDIAGDQYGNYLVQYILMNAGLQHREVVANHIRKHMVSLRGSKFGSRVAMACSNPALATRPGPPTGFGLPAARFNASALTRTGPGGQYR